MCDTRVQASRAALAHACARACVGVTVLHTHVSTCMPPPFHVYPCPQSSPCTRMCSCVHSSPCTHSHPCPPGQLLHTCVPKCVMAHAHMFLPTSVPTQSSSCTPEPACEAAPVQVWVPALRAAPAQACDEHAGQLLHTHVPVVRQVACTRVPAQKTAPAQMCVWQLLPMCPPARKAVPAHMCNHVCDSFCP